MYLILTIPSFIGFLVYSYQNNLAIYRTNAEQQLAHHNDEVADKLANLLDPIDGAAKLIRFQLADNPALFTDPKFIDTLALHLENNPNLVSIFTASAEGAFRQVQNIAAPGMIIADRVPPAGAVLAVWKVDRARNQKVAVSEYSLYKTQVAHDSIAAFEIKNNYDPRSRPFFKSILESLAKAPDGNFTQIDPPYIAASTKKPTLSAATPIVVDKTFLGMTSQSFSLETIAKFLSSIRVSKNSEAFIVDEVGNILVRTKFDEGFTVTNGVFKSRQITDIANSPLSYVASARAGAKETILSFKFGPQHEEYIAKFTPIKNDFNKKWEVLTIAPMNDFLEPLNAINARLIAFATVLIVVSMLIYFYLSRIVSRPIELLTLDIKGLLDFNLQQESHNADSHIDEIDILSDAVLKLKTTLNAFTSYVPRDLVNDLIKSDKPIEIGGESRYLTILFSDLEDFSGLSEVTPSRDLLKRVSSYLELMTYAVKEESGTVDKFIGDAVMAFWGAPLINQNHGYHACVAAIKSKRRMAQLNEALALEKKRPLKVRIGIHSDAVLVGNIGSQERLSYTVMGDGVNIASRLEGVNKEFSTTICISHAVFKEAGERLCVRPIDQINVKGRKGEILIYELIGILDGSDETLPSPAEKEMCERTTAAFDLYSHGEYKAAAMLYADIRARFNDRMAQVMAAKCMDRVKDE
ncbi:MAG: adenylate/guanylate cyclase domain-containing protein [Pseudomonadota bacterium]